MGPKPASTVLTAEQEAIAVAFRQHRTNGQVERFNRTLKEATVQRYHYIYGSNAYEA